VAHQRGVQALTTIAHERAVGRPLIKAALRKPRLELTRDAMLSPALMFRRRHRRLSPRRRPRGLASISKPRLALDA
jgi:hypothetical protein